jgi:hypothetical protein
MGKYNIILMGVSAGLHKSNFLCRKSLYLGDTVIEIKF